MKPGVIAAVCLPESSFIEEPLQQNMFSECDRRLQSSPPRRRRSDVINTAADSINEILFLTPQTKAERRLRGWRVFDVAVSWLILPRMIGVVSYPVV